jgi:hypothetical protein
MNRHDNYRPPEEAKSPKDRVQVHRILLDSGESDVSIARGTWDEEECLLIRWNGSPDQKNGFPARFENMTWMVVPSWMRSAILSALATKINDDIEQRRPDIPFGAKP